MARSTFQGIVRTNGGAGKGNSTPGVVSISAVVAFNPVGAAANVKVGTSHTTGENFILPDNAVPISFLTIGGATGGTNPTVNIGTAADPDGFFVNADADTKGSLAGASGALVVGAGISGPVQVTANQGSSAATGGTTVGVFTYTIADDGAESN
mgnify:FL=1